MNLIEKNEFSSNVFRFVPRASRAYAHGTQARNSVIYF